VLLLPFLAIPLPVAEDAYEPLPWWFAMILFGVPFGVGSMAVGIAARKALGWRTSA
jgi:hypothetical protein